MKRLRELLAGIDILGVIGDIDVPVAGIACHSQKVEPGFCYVAIKGRESDGIRYLVDATTRGAVAVVSAPAGTQLLLPASTAATVDQHLDKFTLTTPAWILNTEYYFLKVVAVCPATTQIDLLGAVANYTFRA